MVISLLMVLLEDELERKLKQHTIDKGRKPKVARDIETT